VNQTMQAEAPDARAQLREFIVERFLFGRAPAQLLDGDSLLERGLIDSTGVLEIVTFLEQRFGIVVDDDELVPENLDSIERIAGYLERKRAARGSSRAAASPVPGGPA
jgi:acyl carrier protein